MWRGAIYRIHCPWPHFTLALLPLELLSHTGTLLIQRELWSRTEMNFPAGQRGDKCGGESSRRPPWTRKGSECEDSKKQQEPVELFVLQTREAKELNWDHRLAKPGGHWDYTCEPPRNICSRESLETQDCWFGHVSYMCLTLNWLDSILVQKREQPTNSFYDNLHYRRG